jgi:hypothetical protein
MAALGVGATHHVDGALHRPVPNQVDQAPVLCLDPLDVGAIEDHDRHRCHVDTHRQALAIEDLKPHEATAYFSKLLPNLHHHGVHCRVHCGAVRLPDLLRCDTNRVKSGQGVKVVGHIL